jgi:hypothetical protein
MTAATAKKESNPFADYAMLVRVKITKWEAKKVEEEVTDEVNASKQAQRDAGQYVKDCMKHPLYKQLMARSRDIRNKIKAVTAPWTDEGEYLLPVSLYETVDKIAYDGINEVEALKKEIMADPKAIHEFEKKRLGALYNKGDYPSMQEIVNKFTVKVLYYPVPDTDRFGRLGMRGEKLKKVEMELKKTYEDQVNIIRTDLWSRMYEVVAHLADRLKDKDTTFKDVTIHKAIGVCDLLDQLNVIGDVDVKKMTKELREKFEGYQADPKVLRTDKKERKVAFKAADDLLKKMDGFLD